jgi:hypothetical protein
MREIVKAKVLPFAKGWLLCEFDNGESRFVDIKPSMKGLLDKLHNADEFSKVYIDLEAGTVAWPGEIHIDPDTLYDRGVQINEIENLFKAFHQLKSEDHNLDLDLA